MADPPSKNSTDSKSCPSNHTPTTSQKFTKSSRNVASQKFDWTESQQDLLLGSFYYGYTVTVWPFGLLADIIGARYVIFFSLFDKVLNFVISIFCERIEKSEK